MATKEHDKEPEEVQPVSPADFSGEAKYRVLHSAVSGFSADRKGVLKERDFYKDSIVTEKQLDGGENVAYYLALGAIEKA